MLFQKFVLVTKFPSVWHKDTQIAPNCERGHDNHMVTHANVWSPKVKTSTETSAVRQGGAITRLL
uniref:Uncharacterized protein n=1 Tax=Arundo donax TaxID=35708 RepID=A0A0A9AUI2_ARUDO